MTIDDNIKHEKLQYDIYTEVAKILTLSSSKNEKYEYLTGEEILPPYQSRIIEKLILYILHSVEHLKTNKKQGKTKWSFRGFKT